MALGFGRLSVLESKLSIYEDLSKEMLDKLERAVGTISDNSNKISIILERHENRLDESARADSLIIKMIEELKEKSEQSDAAIDNRISKIQKKVDANAKFVVGVTAVLTTLVAVLQLAPPMVKVLTDASSSANMDKVRPLSSELS